MTNSKMLFVCAATAAIALVAHTKRKKTCEQPSIDFADQGGELGMFMVQVDPDGPWQWVAMEYIGNMNEQ